MGVIEIEDVLSREHMANKHDEIPGLVHRMQGIDCPLCVTRAGMNADKIENIRDDEQDEQDEEVEVINLRGDLLTANLDNGVLKAQRNAWASMAISLWIFCIYQSIKLRQQQRAQQR